MKKFTGFVSFILAAGFLSGCATVFKGTSQNVTFNSSPEGASILVDGNVMGRTPQAISLKKNKYKSVIIKKEGYEDAIITLNTSYDPVALLNVFWDSSTTDLLTGNAYEYEPGMYSVNLQKKDESQKK